MSDVNRYYTRSFSSFSGADIKANFAGVNIGTLQAISYAIQREKAPIYVMGDPNPKAFSRGKRGIAGTMIFVMFDDHAVLSAFEGLEDGRYMKFVKDNDEISPELFREGADVDEFAIDDDTPANPWDDYRAVKAFYVDQIPPFDVTVAAANETAAAAVLRVWGVELLNEGYGISVDDMVSEKQTTYVARAISRWRRANREDGWNFTATREAGGVVIEEGGATGTIV